MLKKDTMIPYIGIAGLATTIILALTGFFSSSVNAVDKKVDNLGMKVAEDKAVVAERLGRIDTNVANIKDSLASINSKLK